MNRPLKIAVYSGEIPSTTFIERLIFGLSKKGCQVYLFGYLKSAKKYSKNIHVYGYNDNRIYKFFLLLKYSILLFLFRRKDKRQLDEIIKKDYKNKAITKIKYYPVLWYKPDVFHLQWAKSIEDWIWVQEFGIKFIVSLRGTHVSISPISNRKVLKRYQKYFPLVDGFHAVSNTIAKEVEKYGVDSKKVKVVYSGLPDLIGTISKDETNKVFKIISVGRNHWVKGYHYAIDSCKILKEKGFQFEYQIIGAKGSEELDFLIQSNNLQNEVLLTDKTPFAEVQQLIKNADLLLLPSVEEGVANVVLEAMQLGTIVLSTDCGGMEEVVENEENGFIVPIRDSEKMVNSIIRIANLTQDERNTIIEKAKETIKNQHTEVKMIENIHALYKNVINE